MDNKDKMNITELYQKLYKENIEELEKLRKGQRNLLFIILGCFLFVGIIGFTAPFLMPILSTAFIAVIIIIIVKAYKDNKNKIAVNEKNEKVHEAISYGDIYKEKIITPIIENQIPSCTFAWYNGMSSIEYNKGEWERYDRYRSEDEIRIKLNIEGVTEQKELALYEVHTEDRRKDSDGDTYYVTLFHGLAGQMELPKDIGCYIKVVMNRFLGGKANKLEMDMAEFEKVFDVITNDKIKAMQILTSDVMVDFMNIIEQSNIKFEFYINGNIMHIRFHTGSLFEPALFKSAMQLDKIVKYCDITKMTIKTVEDICNKIMEVEI